MKVFGTSLNVMVRQENNVHQVICSLQVLNMLMDAHDILEPIFMDNQPHWISHADFTDLEAARLAEDLFVVRLTLEPMQTSA